MKTRQQSLAALMRTTPRLESDRDYLRIERVVMGAAGHEMTEAQEDRLEQLSALLLAYDAGRNALTRSRLVDADRREAEKAESPENPKRRNVD